MDLLSFSLWRGAWLIVECGIERLFRHSHLSPLSKIGSSQASLPCAQCSHPVCHWSFQAYSFLLFGPAPMISSTAPIECAPLYRWSFQACSYVLFVRAARLNPELRASNDHVVLLQCKYDGQTWGFREHWINWAALAQSYFPSPSTIVQCCLCA